MPAPNNRLARILKNLSAEYGPEFVEYLKKNPDVIPKVAKSFWDYVAARRLSDGGRARRLQVLREEVDYLLASADDQEETDRAADWSKRLKKVERLNQMLDDRSSKAQRKTVAERIASLHSEIFSAYALEVAEDAEKERSED